MTTRDNCGVDDGGTTITTPTTVTAVVAPAATPPPLALTVDGYTSWPIYLNPWTGTVQMWPGYGGVNIQQPLPSAMLAGALTYDLPPQ
jgi:hypothetical protein